MEGAHMPNDAAGAQGEAMPREKSCRADELASRVGTHATLCASATERAQLVSAEPMDTINHLKQERDAAILAHYYVAPEVQAVADYVGDSFYLAKLAKTLPQSTIVLAGVKFMGESAKLLNPAKTVLLPEPAADCPMAHMVARDAVDRARARYGDDLAVVCYVNSTMEIKSWSDVCVTSSNAVKIVAELPQAHILFIPDQNLGRHVARQAPQKHVILNEGYCPRHHRITARQIEAAMNEHPAALVLAHPECTQEVLDKADYIGSTAGIIDYAQKSSAQEFIVVTVEGILFELERRTQGTGKRFYFPQERLACKNMDAVTLSKLVSCLVNGTGEVTIRHDDAMAARAKRALDRMLEYASR